MSDTLVETHGLTKRYGDFTALDDCSFSIQQGEVHGLLGPNGAGKTTLIRLLMGFLRPTTGSARIAGLDCYLQSVEVHRRVAYMPGEARLFPHMRGHQVVRFFGEIRGRRDHRKAFELAERLKLDVSRRVAFMSTGMRQKLALTVTLAADTELMILDEPTANLDPNVRGEVSNLVLEAQQAGRTILFSSHVLSEVEETCDRVSIVRAGQLVHVQEMSQLRRQHRIRARLVDELPVMPSELRREITKCHVTQDRLTIETPGDLSPLLGWLSTLPIDEVTIEPIGLRAVYDRYHSAAAVGESSLPLSDPSDQDLQPTESL